MNRQLTPIETLFFSAKRGLNIPRLYNYLKKACKENIKVTFALIFYIRDCRGGKGEKDLGRRALIWLFLNYPMHFWKILHLIPEYGRWDDLLQLFPKVLNLNDIDFVRKNYISEIPTLKELDFLRFTQKKLVDYFGFQLTEDKKSMLQKQACTLASKWAPTENCSLDRRYGLCKCLTAEMGITLKQYRKEYIKPLRKYIEVTERLMCKRRWKKVEYNKVPLGALKKYKKVFLSHDKDRFSSWWKNRTEREKEVEKKENPREIIHRIRVGGLISKTGIMKGEGLINSWHNLVQECKQSRIFEKTVVVCDTSSSMYNNDFKPLEMSIALGILVSSCSNFPFVMNVGSSLEVTELQGNLYQQYFQISRIKWGGVTDISKICKTIEQRINIYGGELPERIIIVSDTDISFLICEKANIWIPEIIHWKTENISGMKVEKINKKIKVISGLSDYILKGIIEGNYCARDIINSILGKPRYLRVMAEIKD